MMHRAESWWALKPKIYASYFFKNHFVCVLHVYSSIVKSHSVQKTSLNLRIDPTPAQVSLDPPFIHSR